eukprot:Nitzschia sp. Nitz4//scaffold12_size214221//211873//213720//NITZ4_001542-RA/size214221-processed-gene-0.138-mRNA-1//1//CDS//3329535146//4890//frame0
MAHSYLPFQRYDDEFKSLKEQVQGSLDGDNDDEESDFTGSLLKQCDELLQQMALEARSVPEASLKRELLAQVRTYKTEIQSLKDQHNRASLMSGRGAAANNHRERLLKQQDMLQNQNSQLDNARKVLEETEQVALEIGSELANNRETIESARGRVRIPTSTLSISWLDFVPQILPGKGTSSVETGIEAALILTDDHSKEIWKENFRKENPGIPAIIVDKCADVLSDAFQNIAPAQVKAALKPGGLKKIRPSLEETIVSGLEKNTIVQGLLFGNADRRELLKYLVSKALDYLLKDAETVLAEPSTKLVILDASREDIKQSMSTFQLFWYRVRYFPKQMVAIGVATAYISFSLYQQTKETVLVTTLVGTVTPVWQWGRKVSLSFLSGLLVFAKTVISKTSLMLSRLAKGTR